MHEQTTYERSTYSLLEWLGDVGGLFDGLGLIAHLVIGPVATFVLKAEILSLVFREFKHTRSDSKPAKVFIDEKIQSTTFDIALGDKV